MFRIAFSPAARLAWLGLAVMAVGAILPGTAGLVGIVVGANVAFFSLKYFGKAFAWGDQSRAMLALCGLAFLLGLALLGGGLLVAGNPRFALLVAGLYFCVFAVWTVQYPVGWSARLAAVAGFVLLTLGGILGA